MGWGWVGVEMAVTFSDIGKEAIYINELYKNSNLKITFKASDSNGKILASRNKNNKVKYDKILAQRNTNNKDK